MRTYFDHEKLEVYQLELAFIAWLTPLLAKVKQSGASTRAKFLDDARGSATECAACLDALVAKKLSTMEELIVGKELLLRIVSILTKLIARFDQRLNEEEGSYGTEDE